MMCLFLLYDVGKGDLNTPLTKFTEGFVCLSERQTRETRVNLNLTTMMRCTRPWKIAGVNRESRNTNRSISIAVKDDAPRKSSD